MTIQVVLARFATANPMGQQFYEDNLLRSLSNEGDGKWNFRSVTVSSIRSRLPSDTRLPMGYLNWAPVVALQALGRLSFRGSDLLHRLDLRLPPRGGRDLVTIHDLAPLMFDDEGSLPRAAFASARGSSGVVCPSEFSAQQVREIIHPERVWVTPYAVHDSFARGRAMSEADLSTLGVMRPFVLCGGGATKRKNLGALAAAWPAVRSANPTVTLVLSGPSDPRREEMFRDIAGVRLVGRLRLDDLVGLMRASSAVVVPSTYEGFGLPALEGMTCGVPVVASARASLPALCAEGAILVEPTADGLAEGLLRVLIGGPEIAMLCDAALRRSAEFSWAETAKAHLRIYAEALG